MEIKSINMEVTLDTNAVKNIRNSKVVFSDAKVATEFEKLIAGLPHTRIANIIDLNPCGNVAIWLDSEDGKSVLGISVGGHNSDLALGMDEM